MIDSLREAPSQFETRGKLIDELKECSRSRDLRRGKTIHEDAVACGNDSNVYVATALLHMYAKCGSMDDACRVFDNLSYSNVACWNALILGYAENGEGSLALDLFSQMASDGCEPNARTFLAAIKACTDISRGKSIHLLVLQFGSGSDVYVQSSLVTFYAKCGSMKDAHKVFDNVNSPTVVSWTALIFGYADNGQGRVALDLFCRMIREGCEPNARSFVGALKACADFATKEEGSRERGEKLHLLALRNGAIDIFVQGILVDMYAKCGSMIRARAVFDSVENPNLVCWNALIGGYADNKEGETALELFSRIGLEGIVFDTRTFVAALKASADIAGDRGKSRSRGRKLHILILKNGCDSNVYVQGSLVDMYAKSGSMQEAQNVFNSLIRPDVVAWTALMLGYVENGKSLICLELFSRMGIQGILPDSKAFLVALKCLADLALDDIVKGTSARRGQKLHLLAIKSGCDSDIYVQGALVDMYAKSGSMEHAQKVFDSIKQPNVVSWTTLISGYADNGEGEIALKLFLRMKRQGCEPDAAIYLVALRACGMLGALELGKEFHSEICSREFDHDLNIRNCLVDFYAKCGSLVEAENVFDSHATKDLVSWTSLMAGYSRHGDTKGVFDVFGRMLDTGIQPNSITFRCVLAACSHSGLLDKGMDYFKQMSTKYGINPDIEHYTCLIDLLGRANKLDDAMAFLRSMPSTPNVVSLMSVLGACQKWKHLEVGRLIFEWLISLEEGNAAAYVAMGNIFGCKGMWQDHARLQDMRTKLSQNEA